MSSTESQYRCASNQDLPVVGVISIPITVTKGHLPKRQKFVVTRLPLNLLGRDSCKSLNISLDQLLYQDVNKVFDNLTHLSRIPERSRRRYRCRYQERHLGTGPVQ
ncbi:hypothetical protein ElyMa_005965800 [Elysia marginata]|uniref:Uncharacterized protein n=1 Tax=Elysia marginata TaxID=1093978 RepID=A0AAV4GC15_9GAST|nr:hypothetical protein ElyMa_005965800 [Elysia marginata]